MDEISVVLAGDSAVVVRFEERIDPRINARAVALARAVRSAHHEGIRDVVPTYRSVAVYVDPLRARLDEIVSDLKRLAACAPESVHDPEPLQIPVCYGEEYGPDLEAVARFASRTEDAVVQLHAGQVYRVYMLGFVPGFAYMGRVDPAIGAPRHPTPRLRVAAGSVGIAGLQTGIYPMETPGGWQLIGRTPLKPFDPSRASPFLFEAGDSVRFVPIDPATFLDAVT